MRNKSIRKNKTNRKKTNLEKTYRKEKYHKKTNRKRTNHKKTKHRKTYLKKRNIQRGGADDEDDAKEGKLDFTDPDMAEALLEEMEEKEAQLQLAAEFGQRLMEKNEELQEENEAMGREKEAALVKAEEAEQRVRELEEFQSTFKNLESDLRGEILDANQRAEDEILGLKDEKDKNEERLRDILKSVNELGSVTEGYSYSSVTNTEYIESTLENMAGVIEEKINQQIRLGKAEATQSLMEAADELQELSEENERLQAEAKQARATRDKAKLEKDSALESLEAEESKNLELIARNQEVVNEHLAAKKVLHQQIQSYAVENKVYRENNTELKAQNEKLSIDLAEKEDCIGKTKRALEGNR